MLIKHIIMCLLTKCRLFIGSYTCNSAVGLHMPGLFLARKVDHLKPDRSDLQTYLKVPAIEAEQPHPGFFIQSAEKQAIYTDDISGAVGI